MTAEPKTTTATPSPTSTVCALARRQQDVATRTQLAAAGVPPRTVSHRCRSGVWQRPLPGVVVLHSGPLTWQQRYRSALLYAGARRGAAGAGRSGAALITGVAALSAYRLRCAPAPEHVREVDVLVPEWCGVRSRGGVRVHRTKRLPRAVLLDGRLPVAPLRRAVADAVRGRGGQGVTVPGLLHEVVQTGRLAPDQLAEELRAAQLSGREDVAGVLEEVADGARSPAEGLARGVVLATDLPRPLWNPRLTLDGAFLAVPDAYWPRHGVILEVDSKRHHWAVEDWEATMARHNRLAALGFRVLHVSPKQVRDRPGEVVAALRAALTAGPHGPVTRVRVGR
ncbi:type IV toxin-antitoxin system AbiEi family antitoxin domain-containing protein [Streptomyces sp. JJ36]|uniref:type IV toxin-antitoxin system AbiEi family antitoxin domain-containing protein n=1 Tax=Streptomyces sp. JJ36 TaxID=2736645 RepID=UPI001F31AA09|nr:type IV toxin-antitoxin system AbiEi family antitoxin domain-containing protein [Streptomyces sp. JJ36]MCF6522821.1 type IV toxin-antitoxin system AbiEi family antitoxin domain-containing protein [Streptomyces sp. JJ36]